MAPVLRFIRAGQDGAEDSRAVDSLYRRGPDCTVPGVVDAAAVYLVMPSNPAPGDLFLIGSRHAFHAIEQAAEG